MTKRTIISFWFFIICVIWLLWNVNADECTTLNWSTLVADDWTYLGILSSNSFLKDSIANEFSTYGSQFNSKSIFNEFGTYGSQFNPKSPWNEFSSKWPLIIKGKKTLWRLTLNQFTNGYLNTFAVLLCFIKADDSRLKPYLELIDDSSSTYTPVTTYIPPKKTQTQLCQERFWSNAIVWSTTNACDCKEWYIWSLDGNSCVQKNDKTLLAICQNKFWSNVTIPSKSKELVWNDGVSGIKANACVCKDWYAWAAGSSFCELKTADNSCFDDIAYYLSSDWTCQCNLWYKKDPSGIFCDLDEEANYANNTSNNLSNNISNNKNSILELQEAISWMYNQWLTTFKTISSFMWEDYLTREQASKFFVQFWKKILWKIVDTKKIVILGDLKKANGTLQSYIKEANQLGLFKWANGMFLPFNNLTRAQTIAVIIRANNWQQNEKTNPWYMGYYNIINNYWLLSWLSFDVNNLDSTNIKRKEVALLLYRLNNYILSDDSSIKLCQQVGGQFGSSNWVLNSSWTYDCTCKEWYVFSKNTKQCVTASKNCQEYFWEYSYSNLVMTDNWQYNCLCSDWYNRSGGIIGSSCAK